VTVMSFSSSAAIFDAASPFPPEMIAPAWPIRFPGGAETPAMKLTTGLFSALLAASQAAASSSA
jgi:hypothetical protein